MLKTLALGDDYLPFRLSIRVPERFIAARLIHHKIAFQILPPHGRVLAALGQLPHLLDDIGLELADGDEPQCEGSHR